MRFLKTSFHAFGFMLGLGFAFSAHADRSLRGYYEVPVDADLATSARFDIRLDDVDYEDGAPTTLNFPLPVELTGKPTIISMNRVSPTSTEWAGSNVTGNCDTVDRDFTCRVKFNGLDIDTDAAKKAISDRFPDSNEINRRIQVQGRFSAEPIGILVYHLRGRGHSRGD